VSLIDYRFNYASGFNDKRIPRPKFMVGFWVLVGATLTELAKEV